MDGDDADEFFGSYHATFGVDLGTMQWDRHFGPEFCFFPIWMLFPSWWKWQKTMVEIRLDDLLQSAQEGAWTIQYEKRANQPPDPTR
jgi:hypothetical protein